MSIRRRTGRVAPNQARRSPRSTRLFLVLLAVLIAAACATGSGKRTARQAEVEREPVTVFVRNYNWATMHVYVVGAGQQVSMGQLSSMDTVTYVVPTTVVATDRSIQLIADPIGSFRAYISQPVLVSPGDRVEFTINSMLSQSVISVR